MWQSFCRLCVSAKLATPVGAWALLRSRLGREVESGRRLEGLVSFYFSSLCVRLGINKAIIQATFTRLAASDLHKQIVLNCGSSCSRAWRHKGGLAIFTGWPSENLREHARQAQRKHDRFIVGSVSVVAAATTLQRVRNV